MTITLPLQPREEARLIAVAQAKGLSPDALVREVLESILAEAAGTAIPPGSATGSALVAAMQASPYRDLDLEAARHSPPVRDVEI